MLWIQYHSPKKQETAFVQDTTAEIASLLAPYPVGAFDIGSYGVGLVFHNGLIDVDDQEDVNYSSGPEHDSDGFDDTGPENPLAANEGTDFSAEHLDNITTARHVTATSDSQFTVDASLGNISNRSAITHSQPENGETNAPSKPGNSNVGGQNPLPPALSGNDSNLGPGSGDGPGSDGGGSGGGHSNRAANDGPPSQEGNPEYEMFSGVANVRLPGYEQRLYISFALQIFPSDDAKRSAVGCKIALDNVVFGASAMEYLVESGVESDHYFVLKEAQMTAGPSDGECSPPHSVIPRERYFIIKFTETNNWQAGANSTISPTPAVAPNVSFGSSKQKEHPSSTVEIEGFECGGGPRQSYRWCYRPKSKSAETHMEFSSTNPPTHTVSFTVPRNKKNPTTFSIRTRAVYQRKGIFRRLAAMTSARLRLKQDVQLRHFTMELEANIGLNSDYYRFPVAGEKEGAFLTMKVDAQSGMFKPIMEDAGLVKTSLTGQGLKVPNNVGQSRDMIVPRPTQI